MAFHGTKARSASASNSGTASHQSTYYVDSSWRAWVRIFLKILYVVLVLAALFFAYLNINPYVKIVTQLLEKTDVVGFGEAIKAYPGLDKLSEAIGRSNNWVFGVVLWAGLQLVELAPMVIFRDKAMMKMLIEDHDRTHKFTISDKDDPVAAGLKMVYNGLPLGFLRNLGKWRIVAYGIDLIICFTVYPPAQGGFLRFLLYIMTGAWNRLDWTNITLTIATLFAVELIVGLLFGIGALIHYFRKSRTVSA